MAKFVNKEGLKYFYTQLTNLFAPIVHNHTLATKTSSGFMSSSDKIKLDNLDTSVSVEEITNDDIDTIVG